MFKDTTQTILLIKNFIKNLQMTFSDEEIERTLVYYYLSCKGIVEKYQLLNLKEEIKEDILLQIDKIFVRDITLYDLAFLFENLLNEKIRVSNGVVFTPKYISNFIIQNLLKDIPLKRDIKILDPACGTGIFLLVALELLSSSLKKSKLEIIKDNIYGIDIIKENVERTILLLKLACIDELDEKVELENNIIVGNSLTESWTKIFNLDNFDMIVGNPPYVNPHDLDKETTKLLKKNFISTKIGTTNIFYAFLERSTEFISESGKVSYIIPNNFLVINAAKNLRKFLKDNMFVEYILDFTSNLVFKPVRSYNAIIVLSKGKKESLYYSLIPYSDDVKKELLNIEILNIDYKHLDENRWNLLEKTELENIKKIETIGYPIKEMIKTGIATLKDNLYLVDGYDFKKRKYYKDYEDEIFYIESELIKPVYKISEIKDSEEIKNFERAIIFPYKKNIEGKFSIISEEELKSNYPEGYKYFLRIRNILDTRDKGKKNPVAWYAYGRSQGINNYGKKLMYPTFANKPKFSLVEDEMTLFFNGYSIFESKEIELKILQKILNSKVMKYYIDNTSYPIEGGYMCYQKKYIQNFTIPFFTKTEIEFLREEENPKMIDRFLIKKYDLMME